METRRQSILHVRLTRQEPCYVQTDLNISAQGAGEGDWADAYSKAKETVFQMTNEEKNLILTPAINFVGCSGFTGSVRRLNFSGICLNDAESGVRTSDNESVSGYPALLTVGASWDKGLAYLRGQYLGAELKAKGVNVALGPVVGPLGRVAKGGRNWEGMRIPNALGREK